MANLSSARFLPWFGKAGAQIRFGVYRHAFQLLKPWDDKGKALLKQFLRHISTDDVDMNVAGRSGRQLIDWIEKQNWDRAAQSEFGRAVARLYRASTYGRAPIDIRFGKLIKTAEALDRGTVGEMWGVLKSHVEELRKAAPSSASVRAFDRLHDLLGTEDEGWERVLRLLKKDPEKIAAWGEELRAAKAAGKKMPSAAQGFQSILKGALGEIYLAKWPVLKAQMAEALKSANDDVARLGKGWEALHVVGEIRVGPKESYDQAILLINRNTSKTIVKAAAQMKVERNKLSVVPQIGGDASRELVTPGASALERTNLPVLQIVEKGKPLQFSVLPTPEWMDTRRYVFFAEGAAIRAADVRRATAMGFEVRATVVDLHVTWLEELATEIMVSARKMIPPVH